MVPKKHFFFFFALHVKEFFKNLLQVRTFRKAINTCAEPYACPQGTQNYSIIPESLWNVNPGPEMLYIFQELQSGSHWFHGFTK
jgi:hypothetical protein